MTKSPLNPPPMPPGWTPPGWSHRDPAVERFADILRKANSSLASLPPKALRALMDGDDKSTFIIWFESRPDFEPDDWSTLLMYLRDLLPDLFSGHGDI